MGVAGQSVTVDGDDVESDEETVDEENNGGAVENPGRAPRRGRRLLHRNKKINSLQEALNPENYNPLTMPTAAEEKVLSAIMVDKKGRQPEEKIEWTNVKRSSAGRLPRYIHIFVHLYIHILVYWYIGRFVDL